MSPHSHCSHAVQGKALYGTLFIALVFMAIEVMGGIIASSLALYSDALHLLMDAGALVLALIVLKIAHLPRTLKMSYGYQRAEILGRARQCAFSLGPLRYFDLPGHLALKSSTNC